MTSSRSCLSRPQPISLYCWASSRCLPDAFEGLVTSAAAQAPRNPRGTLLLIHVLHVTVHLSTHSLHSTRCADAYQELPAVPKPAAAILTRQHKRKRFTGNQRTARVKFTVQFTEETKHTNYKPFSFWPCCRSPAVVSKLLQALFSAKTCSP